MIGLKGSLRYSFSKENELCEKCDMNPCYAVCKPMKIMMDLVEDGNDRRRYAQQASFARRLEMDMEEPCEWMKRLAGKVIKKFDQLDIIDDYEIKVGYVLSQRSKRSDGKPVYGECQKVDKNVQAFIPYDFIITFYEPNCEELDDNQMAILMYHELRHIGYKNGGASIVKHEVQDFNNILNEFGLDWTDEECPDILDKGFEFGGDDDE